MNHRMSGDDTFANVLIITRNFPPLTGGMEKLTFHTYEALRKHYHCALVGPAGCAAFVPPDATVEECHLKPLPRFLMDAFVKGVKVGRLHRPRLVIAASGLTAPIAVYVARKLGSAAITVVHGLDLIAPHALYQKIFLPAIRASDIVIANSANTARLAQSKGIKPDKIEVLHPGATLPASVCPSGNSPRNPAKAGAQRHRPPSEKHKILLSVGRLVPRKGLAEFVDRAMPEIVRRDPNVMLLIAGGEATDALNRSARVRDRIEQAIKRNNLQDHVRLLERIADDASLDALYREADVFVLPLIERPDDVEGFGMVAVEAAANGLPTVGFKLGGLSDAVEDGRSGVLAPPGDYRALIDAILGLLKEAAPAGITSETCHAHAQQFSWDQYEVRLNAICRQILALQAVQ